MDILASAIRKEKINKTYIDWEGRNKTAFFTEHDH
jgi:hypothetical protein